MGDQSYDPYTIADKLCPHVEQNLKILSLLEHTIVIETAIFTEYQVIEMKLALICESLF